MYFVATKQPLGYSILEYSKYVTKTLSIRIQVPQSSRAESMKIIHYIILYYTIIYN